MSRFTIVLAGLAFLGAPFRVPKAAGAARTDMARFQKLVYRYAPPAPSRRSPVKSLCVCQDGTNQDGTVGILLSEGPSSINGEAVLKVYCAPEGFNNTGAQDLLFQCYKWVPLVR